MAWFNGFIRKQGQLMLANDIYALFNTVILVLLPYTGWLAASIIALVTLRKSIKTGGLLVVAAVFPNFMVLNSSLSVTGAIVGSLLSYFPCYLAAVALRLSQQWRIVSCVIFIQVLVVMFFLHQFYPQFIMQQYAYLREALNQLHFEETFFIFSKDATVLQQTIFANYLLGIQAAGVGLSACMSLALARFIQSKLYYPEGFKLEMRTLRASKIDLLLFIVVLFAAKQQYLIAIDMLPLLLLFFFMTGVSLWFDCMSIRGMFAPMLILSVVLGVFPHVMLLIYVLVGSLDVLVNFRLYLHSKVDTTIREVK